MNYFIISTIVIATTNFYTLMIVLVCRSIIILTSITTNSRTIKINFVFSTPYRDIIIYINTIIIVIIIVVVVVIIIYFIIIIRTDLGSMSAPLSVEEGAGSMLWSASTS